MSVKKKHASMKIHAGDRVVVLSGKDKGAEGVVERAIPEREKVIVEGINVARKHQAPDSRRPTGRDHRQSHADRRVQRRCGESWRWQGHTSRLPESLKKAKKFASVAVLEVEL